MLKIKTSPEVGLKSGANRYRVLEWQMQKEQRWKYR